MYKRYAKITLVFSIALYCSLVVFNNLVDYGANYRFVSHVLQMDTIFPNSGQTWRAIASPLLHHAAYGLIILVEFATAALCWVGGLRLCRSVEDGYRFDQAKDIAILGLTLGIVLWFTGFIAIGGEWFLMWQSKTWNGQQGAFRPAAVMGIVLVFLAQPDRT